MIEVILKVWSIETRRARRTVGDLRLDLELAKTFCRRDMSYTLCLSRLNHESGSLFYSLELAGSALLYSTTFPRTSTAQLTTTVQRLGVLAVRYHAPFTVSFDRNHFVFETTSSNLYTVHADKVEN